jgi:hypothetical protein
MPKDKVKEFQITMVVYNTDNKYTEEEIDKMFTDWVESKDLFCGGMIKELTE